jgi:hypothetical protein
MMVLHLLQSWLKRRAQRRASQPRHKIVLPSCRPVLENLEDRLVPGSLLNLNGFLPVTLATAVSPDDSSLDSSSNAVYNPSTAGSATPSTPVDNSTTSPTSTPSTDSSSSDTTPTSTISDNSDPTLSSDPSTPPPDASGSGTSTTSPIAAGTTGGGGTTTGGTTGGGSTTPTSPGTGSGTAANSAAAPVNNGSSAAASPAPSSGTNVNPNATNTPATDPRNTLSDPNNQPTQPSATLALQVPKFTNNTSPTVQVAMLNVPADDWHFASIDIFPVTNGQLSPYSIGTYYTALVGNSYAPVTLYDLPTGTYGLLAQSWDDNGNPLAATNYITINPDGAGQTINFEQNVGQADSSVSFLSRSQDYGIYLLQSGGYQLQLPDPDQSSGGTLLNVALDNSNNNPTVLGQNEVQNKTNYLLGADPSQWITNVANFNGVLYQNVYNGIDVSYSGFQGDLEQQFDVHSGANPGQIQFNFGSDWTASTDPSGNLVLSNVDGIHTMTLSTPQAYQLESDGVTQDPVSISWQVNGDGTASFQVASYDSTRDLYIDPSYIYSSFQGGSKNDTGNHIAFDGAGDSYTVGNTNSNPFPTSAGAVQSTLGNVGSAGFVTKLNASGVQLWSTYVGATKNGDNTDANSIAVDAAGNAYITGDTSDRNNFPLTSQTISINGVPTKYNQQTNWVYVAKIDNSGSKYDYNVLVAQSFFGGDGTGIAVDAANDAYFTGHVNVGGVSTFGVPFFGVPFFNTTGAFQDLANPNVQNAQGDVTFVGKLDSAGTTLLYGTFLNGPTGNAFGSGTDSTDLTIDEFGDAYVTGWTDSNKFPVTANAVQGANAGGKDAFLAELSANGQKEFYGTYIGGSGDDEGEGIARDAFDNIYVAGNTQSKNLPTTAAAFNAANPNGDKSGFVAAYNPNNGATHLYTTYLTPATAGQEVDANDVAVDTNGYAYVAGQTNDGGFSNFSSFGTNLSPASPAPGGGKFANFQGYYLVLNHQGTGTFEYQYIGGMTGGGGGSSTTVNGIAVDGGGNIYMTGKTGANMSFPTVNAFQMTNGGMNDAFIMKIHGDIPQVAVNPNNPNPNGGGGGPPPPPPPPGGGGPTNLPEDNDPNDSEDVATDLGGLGANATFSSGTESCQFHNGGLPDFDWFKIAADANGTMTLTVTALSGGPFEFSIWTLDGSGNFNEQSTTNVASSASLTLGVASGQEMFFLIKGIQTSPGVVTGGTYKFSVGLS